jgi:predicted dehydrogenase
MNNPLDRRHFVGVGLATATVGSLRLESASPNRSVVVGIMGLHSRGTRLAQAFAKTPDVEVGYLCDVDARAFEKAAKAIAPDQEKPGKQVVDFRRMLDDKDVDAIVIATPDHWHAPAAILACAAGKDVYVEKPCSHNPREGELLVAAAEKHKRIVQMGNQRRSWPAVRDAITAAKTKIGRAYFGRCWYANSRAATGRRVEAATPKWLDWEQWQGPAPRRPFSSNIVPYKWHWYWDWGTGELGNNAVHAVDLARWALDVDYATRIVSSGGRYHFDDAQETPDAHMVSWEFPGRKQITFETMSCNRYGVDGTGFGACILGTEGSVTIGAREWVRRDLRGKVIERAKIAGGNAPHVEDFIQSMRTRRAPNSEIVGGHQSTLLTHLGNIAHRTSHALRCDAKTGHILDDDDATRLWSRDYEAGWAPRV